VHRCTTPKRSEDTVKGTRDRVALDPGRNVLHEFVAADAVPPPVLPPRRVPHGETTHTVVC